MIKVFDRNGYKYFLLSNDNLAAAMRVNSGRLELMHFGRPVSENDVEALSVRPGTGWGTSTMLNEKPVLTFCRLRGAKAAPATTVSRR